VVVRGTRVRGDSSKLRLKGHEERKRTARRAIDFPSSPSLARELGERDRHLHHPRRPGRARIREAKRQRARGCRRCVRVG